MKVCDLQRFFREINAGDRSPFLGHRLSEYAAAAAYIERTFSNQRRSAIDPFEAQWIDFVEWTEL